MIKYRIRPEEGQIVLKIVEIKNGECVIDVYANFRDGVREEKTFILEEGDEIGLFDVRGIRITDIN